MQQQICCFALGMCDLHAPMHSLTLNTRHYKQPERGCTSLPTSAHRTALTTQCVSASKAQEQTLCSMRSQHPSKYHNTAQPAPRPAQYQEATAHHNQATQHIWQPHNARNVRPLHTRQQRVHCQTVPCIYSASHTPCGCSTMPACLSLPRSKYTCHRSCCRPQELSARTGPLRQAQHRNIAAGETAAFPAAICAGCALNSRQAATGALAPTMP